MAKSDSYSEAVENNTPAYLPSIVSSTIGGLWSGALLVLVIVPALKELNKSLDTSYAGCEVLAAEKSGLGSSGSGVAVGSGVGVSTTGSSGAAGSSWAAGSTTGSSAAFFFPPKARYELQIEIRDQIL